MGIFDSLGSWIKKKINDVNNIVAHSSSGGSSSKNEAPASNRSAGGASFVGRPKINKLVDLGKKDAVKAKDLSSDLPETNDLTSKLSAALQDKLQEVEDTKEERHSGVGPSYLKLNDAEYLKGKAMDEAARLGGKDFFIDSDDESQAETPKKEISSISPQKISLDEAKDLSSEVEQDQQGPSINMVDYLKAKAADPGESDEEEILEVPKADEVVANAPTNMLDKFEALRNLPVTELEEETGKYPDANDLINNVSSKIDMLHNLPISEVQEDVDTAPEAEDLFDLKKYSHIEESPEDRMVRLALDRDVDPEITQAALEHLKSYAPSVDMTDDDIFPVTQEAPKDKIDLSFLKDLPDNLKNVSTSKTGVDKTINNDELDDALEAAKESSDPLMYLKSIIDKDLDSADDKSTKVSDLLQDATDVDEPYKDFSSKLGSDNPRTIDDLYEDTSSTLFDVDPERNKNLEAAFQKQNKDNGYENTDPFQTKGSWMDLLKEGLGKKSDAFDVGQDATGDVLLRMGNDNVRDDLAELYGEGSDLENEAVSRRRETAVDDGSPDKENRTSMYMTKDQAKWYADNGYYGDVTSEDLDSLPDETILDKSIEAKERGFTGIWSPDEDARLHYLNESTLAMPSNVGAELADFRDSHSPYTMSYTDEEGNSYTVKGKDIEGYPITDKLLGEDTIKSVDEISPEDYDNGTLYEQIDSIPLDNGERLDVPEKYLFSHFVADTYDDPDILHFDLPETGDIYVQRNDVLVSGLAKTNNAADASIWAPNITVGEQTLPYDVFLEFAQGASEESPNIDYDFGPMNINKPKHFLGNLLDKEASSTGTEHTKLNKEDLLPNMVDIAASSSPYFLPQTSIPYALSNAYKSLAGIDPHQAKRKGANGPVVIMPRMSKEDEAQDIEDNNRRIKESSLAEALMPLTEYGLGRIGPGHLGDRIFDLGSKTGKPGIIPAKLGRYSFLPATSWMTGTLGEGAEEIGGNVFEEMAGQGLDSWYGNPLLDEDGNPIMVGGTEKKDPNTSAEDRWANFWEDAPEAFAGGALLGGAFGVPSIPSTIRDTLGLAVENKERKNRGMKPRKMVRAEDVELPAEMQKRYDDAKNEGSK